MRDQASLVCSFIHSTNIDLVSGRWLVLLWVLLYSYERGSGTFIQPVLGHN